MKEVDYIRCPCGNKDNLDPHFASDGKTIEHFTCPCGQVFTGRESAGTRTKTKGANVTDKNRDQALIDASSPGKQTLRLLSCELTDEEQRERGVQAANASNEINRVKAEAKGIADEFKARVIGAEALHDALKNAVLQKREYREIDCTEYYDFKKGKVYVVRDDLQTIVETRPMTPEERQAVLPVSLAEAAMDEVAAKLDGTKGHSFKTVMGSKNCGLCGEPKSDVMHDESMRGVSIEATDKKKSRTAAGSASATA